jgi:predicted acetyltransferase
LIQVIDARNDPDREWIENVYPLYLHDLSEFDESVYRLNEEGIWEPDYLPVWFSKPGAKPLVLRADGQRIGFALVGQAPFPYRSPDADQQLSEFFILRSYRRRKLGRAAAISIFKAFPGVWELFVLISNQPAQAFWRSVLEASGTAYETEAAEGATRFRFRIWLTGP